MGETNTRALPDFFDDERFPDVTRRPAEPERPSRPGSRNDGFPFPKDSLFPTYTMGSYVPLCERQRRKQ